MTAAVDQERVFMKIWTSPRAVFRFIDEYRYEKHMTLMLVLAGIARAFDRAEMRNEADHSPLGLVIGLSIALGGLFGWITYYMYAGMVSVTGEWIGGKANTDRILRMLAYALLPSVISLAFLIPQIAIYGGEVFKSDGDFSGAGVAGSMIFYIAMILQVALSMWSIVLCVIGLSEVQQFSIGKSILNLLLPAIAIVGVVALFILIADAMG